MPDLQDPKSFTVKILHLQQQTTVGTGFVISNDGLIATCAHVLAEAGVNPQTGKLHPNLLELIFRDIHSSSKDLLRNSLAEIPIYFKYAIEKKSRSQKATLFYSFVENEASGYKDDIVILKLKGDTLPDGIKPAIISAAEKSVGHSPNHGFRSFGFPKSPHFDGLPADGTIFDFAGERVDKILRLPQLILISDDIAPGYSGAAVQDKDKNISKVIGIIVEESLTDKEPLAGKSFAIDCSILQFCTKQLNLPSESSSILNTQIPTYQSDSETVENFSDDEQIIPVAIQQKASTVKLLLSDAPAPVSKEIWVDRPTLLKNLSHDWENSQVLITGLIGLGGEGKSALVRQWIEHLTQSDLLQPDGVFWWSFSPQKGADQFLEALLNFLDPAIDPNHLFSSSQKVGKINEIVRSKRYRYLFILDGLEILQYQEGDEYGLLDNIEIRNWLRDFSEGKHQCFCIVTSRIPILDLIDFTTYKNQNVEGLNHNEGVLLLKNLGAEGVNEELQKIVKECDGHVLTLCLLASYWLEKHEKEISYTEIVRIIAGGEKGYNRLNQILDEYNSHLSIDEKNFLMKFSALRTSVSEDAIYKVIEPPINRPKQETAKLVHGLVNRYLLKYNSTEQTYASHPLIKSYYLERFYKNDKFSRAVHLKMAGFYYGNAKKLNIINVRRPTLESLSPFIEAVHHFCQAKYYHPAYKIFDQYIEQGNRHVLSSELGAYDTYLNLILDFFPDKNFLERNPESHAVRLLKQTGFCLMSTGRLQEALSVYRHSRTLILDTPESGRMWKSHKLNSIYRDTATLYLYMGNFTEAANSVADALDCHGQDYDQSNTWALSGWISHLKGDAVKASEAFHNAMSLQREAELTPISNHLYRSRGIYYADYLRRHKMYDDARKVTLVNLDICKRNNWINSVCLCYGVLGDLDADIGQHDNARSNYEKALENVQNIYNQPVLIQILSAIGSWCARWDKVTTAEDYLNKALRYAVKGDYQLYKVDIYIGLAWMYFISGNTRKSEEKAQSAKQMSEEMGYYWGKLDAEELLSLNFSQTLSG